MSTANNFRINPASFPGSFTEAVYGASYNEVPRAKPAGPATPQGKAIAARNATSHGLFARDVVLPHLGEDPAAYNTLHLQFCEQIDPQGLLEMHYVEAIAAASWRLRRLHRWQAQVWEDDTLTEDARLDKLDRVLRHETALHREINTSVRLLGREVPELFAGRARKQALADLEQTERDCRHDDEAERDVALRATEYMQMVPLPSGFDWASLDNTREEPPAPMEPPAPVETEKCQNEPGAADADASMEASVEAQAPEAQAPEAQAPEAQEAETEKCQNDDAPAPVEAVSQDVPPQASQDTPGAAPHGTGKGRNELTVRVCIKSVTGLAC